MFTPTRRQILFTAIGAMSVLAARDAFLLYCGTVARNTPDFFASLDEGVLDAARQVGHKVKRLQPEFGTQVALARFYGDHPLLVAAHEQSCLDTRRTLLQQQCCEDFSAGRTLIVDGWVVSETEAQLCASLA